MFGLFDKYKKKKQYEVQCYLSYNSEMFKPFRVMASAKSRREAIKIVNTNLAIVARSAHVVKPKK